MVKLWCELFTIKKMGQLFTSEQGVHPLLTEQDLGRNPTLLRCQLQTGYRSTILYHSRQNTYHEFVSFNRFRATPYHIPAGATLKPLDPEVAREYNYDYDVQYVVPRTVPEAEAGQTAFHTHDNGGRPYLVYLSKSPNPTTHEVKGPVDVAVYRIPNGTHDKLPELFAKQPESERRAYYTQIAYRAENVAHVWVGTSPRHRITEFGDRHGPAFLGNSFLLHLGGVRYVFVGDRIYQFEAYAPITVFTSHVGNNDVPYPYARDRDHRFYFLLGEGYVLQYIPDEHAQNDPYTYANQQQPNILNHTRDVMYGSLVGFYVGTEPYDLSFAADAHKDYKRLTSAAFSDGVAQKLFVENVHGEKREVTEADYVALMRRVGRKRRERGFLPLKRYRILVKRDA